MAKKPWKVPQSSRLHDQRSRRQLELLAELRIRWDPGPGFYVGKSAK